MEHPLQTGPRKKADKPFGIFLTREPPLSRTVPWQDCRPRRSSKIRSETTPATDPKTRNPTKDKDTQNLDAVQPGGWSNLLADGAGVGAAAGTWRGRGGMHHLPGGAQRAEHAVGSEVEVMPWLFPFDMGSRQKRLTTGS